MAISVSLTATTAAIGGTLPSMVQNARPRQPLMVYFYCIMALAGKRIHIAHVTLKESARSSIRARSAWDSGSVSALLVTKLATRIQAGTQSPRSI